MSSVWKRLQRVNKRAAKFRIVTGFHELMIEGSNKWYQFFDNYFIHFLHLLNLLSFQLIIGTKIILGFYFKHNSQRLSLNI
jgi:hypothetical protein